MTIYDVFDLQSRVLHQQFRETPSFLVLFISLFCDVLFSYNHQNSMAHHGQNGPHPAISQNPVLNLENKGNRKGKQIKLLILSKNWTCMTFSGDCIHFIKNIKILKTVALCEMHFNIYNLYQIPEEEG